MPPPGKRRPGANSSRDREKSESGGIFSGWRKRRDKDNEGEEKEDNAKLAQELEIRDKLPLLSQACLLADDEHIPEYFSHQSKDGTEKYYKVIHHENDIEGHNSTGFAAIAFVEADKEGNVIRKRDGNYDVLFSFSGTNPGELQDLDANKQALKGDVWPQVQNVSGFRESAEAAFKKEGIDLGRSEITTFSHSCAVTCAVELRRQFKENGIDSTNITMEPMFLENYFENYSENNGKPLSTEMVGYLREGHAYNAIEGKQMSNFRKADGKLGILSDQHSVRFAKGLPLDTLHDFTRHILGNLMEEVESGNVEPYKDYTKSISNEELTDGVERKPNCPAEEPLKVVANLSLDALAQMLKAKDVSFVDSDSKESSDEKDQSKGWIPFGEREVPQDQSPVK